MIQSKTETNTGSYSEKYFQISPQILTSFPKFRPPLNLYIFKEKMNDIEPFHYAGQKLSKPKQKELSELCNEGRIFVARSDYHIYAEHLSKQLDLILMDTNLKEGETADILIQGLTERIREFFEQPVQPIFDTLYNDLLVLTEYLWQDAYREKGLLKRLLCHNTLESLSFNTLIFGLSLYMEIQGKELKRGYLDGMAIGLSCTLLGMSKIPEYARNKQQKLTPDEEKKIKQYPLTGTNILQKLSVKNETALNCVKEHQERINGTGYPDGLRDKEISLPGRIAAISSAFSHYLAQMPQDNSSTPLQISNKLAEMPKLFDSHLASKFKNIIQRTFVELNY